MRTTPLLLVVVVLVALVGALLFTLRAGSSGESHAGGIGDEPGPRPDTELAESDTVDDDPDSDTTGEREGIEGLVAPDVTPTEDAVPDAILVGRIVDQHGEPVAGARVIAATGYAWLKVPLDMETAGLSNDGTKRAEVESDADGRFAFTETLVTGPLRLAVRAPRFAPRYVESLQLPATRPHDLGDIALERGATLEGRIVGLSGDGIPDVELLSVVERGLGGLQVSVPGRGIPLTTTDAEGKFVVDELAVGPWRLILDGPEHRVREESGRTEAPGEVVPGLLFVLEPGDVITGSVAGIPADRAGEVRVEARVKSGRRGRGEDAEPAVEAHPRARRAMCDVAGTFHLRGLVPGVEYRLTAWQIDDEEGDWERSGPVDAKDAWAGARKVELLWQAESALVFQVLDATTGAPLERFVSFAGLRGRLNPLRAEGEEKALTRHPGGRVRHGGLRPGDQGAQAKLRIRATGYEDYEKDGIDLTSGEDEDLGTIELEPAPVVRVTVVDDESGGPVEAARVFVVPEAEVGNVRWWTRNENLDAWGLANVHYGETDETGIADVAAIKGQRCKLVVHSTGHVESEPVDLPATSREDIDVEVRLSSGGAVVVEVVDTSGEPLVGTQVAHRFVDADANGRAREANFWMGPAGGAQATDESGVVRFDHLEVGEHEFRIQPEQNAWGWGMNVASQEEEWEKVSLAAGDEKELRLVGEPRGGLSGVVTEARMPLAGASLRLKPKTESRNRGGWGGGSEKYSALSAHDGSYAFTDIACGEYTLTVSHSDRAMDVSVEVTVASADDALDVELTLAVIEGRVTDTDGRPLAGIDVRVAAKDGSRNQGDWTTGGVSLVEDDRGNLQPDWQGGRPRSRARTDADGEYMLRGVSTAGALRLTASSRYVLPETIDPLELAPDEIRSGVDFRLEPAGRLELRLSGQTNGNFRATAKLVAEEGEPELRRSTSLRGSRARTLDSLRPGTWSITVERLGGAEAEVVVTEQAEVRANEITRISLPVQ